MSALLPTSERSLTGFDEWWDAPGDWVEPPNQRRGGQSGVQRLPDKAGRLLYSKRQIGHIFRSLRHPFGLPTVLREEKILRSLRRLDITVPTIVYCGAVKQHSQWHALLITEALDGYISLFDWLSSTDYQRASPQLRQQAMQAIAATLVKLHRHRWQHGCLYPKHIFLKLQPGVPPAAALLDLEKCRRRLTVRRASQHDTEQLYRHRGNLPEEDWRTLITHYRALLNP